MKKNIVLILVVSLLICGCGSSQTQTEGPALQQPETVDVDTVVVTKSAISNVKSYSGYVIPEIEYVGFEASGNIGDMNVSIGQHVKKGQLLATLAGSDSEEQRQEQQDNYDNTKKQFDDANELTEYDMVTLKQEINQLKKQLKKEKDATQKKLLKQQIKEKECDITISKLKLTQQKETQALELDRLKKQVDRYKSMGDIYEVYAPCSGEVVYIAGPSGYMVQSGNDIVGVAKEGIVKIQSDFVSEADVTADNSHCYALIDGKKYELKQEEYDKEEYSEKIEQGETLTCYFTVKGNKQPAVGSFAWIRLESNIVEDALCVPSNAILKDGTGRYVYMMQNGAKIKKDVLIGTENDAYTQIKDGLKEGDVVYVQD